MDAQMGQYAASEKIGGDGAFLEKLAEKLGQYTTAKTVFGDPVERNGVTVIPVAKARMGFGGGGGGGYGPTAGDEEKQGGGQGQGAGGGSTVSPLGYIEIKDGSTAFRRIHDPATILPFVLAAGLVWLIIFRGLRKLLR